MCSTPMFDGPRKRKISTRPPPSPVTMCGAVELTLDEKTRRGKLIVEFAIKDVCTASAGGRVLKNTLTSLIVLGFHLSPRQQERLIRIFQEAQGLGMVGREKLAGDARTIANEIIRGVLEEMDDQPAGA